jgi:hypothetical protein
MFVIALLSVGSIFALLVVTGQATIAETRRHVISISTPDDYTNAALESISLRNATAITFTPVSTTYLPMVAKAYPWPVYLWLSQQQDGTTGLLPSQQDQTANTYNNALAVMVFTLKGDYAKAKRILDYFKNSASEFFAERCGDFGSVCSTTDPCDGTHPCGFFQSRNSKTGAFDPVSNRWIGDMSWLLMAIHHYEGATGDMSYASMVTATIRLLKNFQQSDGYIASGWMQGDQVFTTTGAHEGNLGAYKALSLFGENQAAQQIKHWLDTNDMGSMVWEAGPLDLHSWRVLSLGKEYGYVLPDVERTDDTAIRYKSTITFNNSLVTGFLPYPHYCVENIWSEGTGGMAASFYKAGYRERGDFYVGELEKLLFEPADFPGTQALSFFALSSPSCHAWADPTKGHVAGVCWYIFAKEHFDPFNGVVMDSFQKGNPVVKIEAENYGNNSGSGIRLDGRGELSEGRGVHIGGDDNTPGNNSGWVEYKFNVLIPTSIITISMRYADDVAGDGGRISLDGNLITSFTTAYTGGWDKYVMIDPPTDPIQIQPGLRTLRLEFTDNGTYGFTVDYFQMLIP